VTQPAHLRHQQHDIAGEVRFHEHVSPGRIDKLLSARLHPLKPLLAMLIHKESSMTITRHLILCIIAVCIFIVDVMLELFGGHSPVPLIPLGLAFGFASFI